jgi:hypothetical protein
VVLVVGRRRPSVHESIDQVRIGGRRSLPEKVQDLLRDVVRCREVAVEDEPDGFIARHPRLLASDVHCDATHQDVVADEPAVDEPPDVSGVGVPQRDRGVTYRVDDRVDRVSVPVLGVCC